MSNYVLVVDDNPSDQKLAKLLIEAEGFVAILASDAKVALEYIQKYEEYQFKLFVVDIQMPEVSGLELLKKIKGNALLKDVPVLIMSGKNTSEDVKKAVDLGASDYIIKPIDREIFTAKVQVHLKNKKSEWYEYPAPEGSKTGHIHELCEIQSFNEISITMRYRYEIPSGENRIVSGSLLDEIGIGTIIGWCTESVKHGGDFYLSKLSLIGLTEEERDKIRQYCRKVYVNLKKND